MKTGFVVHKAGGNNHVFVSESVTVQIIKA